MTVGDIAGLIAAGAFAVLVLLLAVPILKLAGVFTELRRSVRTSTDELLPTLTELHVSATEANRQLAKVDAITSDVHETTSNVNSMVALTAATVGGPLIKLAGFSAAARAGFKTLRPSGRRKKH